MANDVANHLSTFYLKINIDFMDSLYAIRTWQNLKIGIDGDNVWVKNFEQTQIHSNEVKAIPNKMLFYEKESKLFKINSLLPDCTLPIVLWTPIERLLPVKLPTLNHHFFGIQEEITFSLQPSDAELEVEAMVTTIELLDDFIQTASEIRLEKINWTILNENKVLLLGSPILPLQGEVFWRNGDFLFPAGFRPSFSLLLDEIALKINPERENVVLWNTDNSYSLIEKDVFTKLSISSFRLSLSHEPLNRKYG